MHEHECDEPSIVLEAYAIIEPYAVMVELLNTDVAEGAVLGPGWLAELASLTFVVLEVYYIVVLVAPECV